MTLTKQLKSLLSSSYELEGHLSDLLEECFKEIFKDKATSAIAFLQDDLETGMQYNGCIQDLEYFKRQVGGNKANVEEKPSDEAPKIDDTQSYGRGIEFGVSEAIYLIRLSIEEKNWENAYELISTVNDNEAIAFNLETIKKLVKFD